MLRSFVAIELPDTHAAALSRLQERMPAARPVPEENLHLTLAFLGDQPDDLIEAAHYGLEAIGSAAPEVTITGLDSFGRHSPEVIFAAVAPTDQLAALRKRVRGVAHAAGITLSRERFRPHVTLGRLGHLDVEAFGRVHTFMQANGAFALPSFTPPSVTLFQSTLTRSGAIHEALARYPLG